jgi:hypothetical protein
MRSTEEKNENEAQRKIQYETQGHDGRGRPGNCGTHDWSDPGVDLGGHDDGRIQSFKGGAETDGRKHIREYEEKRGVEEAGTTKNSKKGCHSQEASPRLKGLAHRSLI